MIDEENQRTRGMRHYTITLLK